MIFWWRRNMFSTKESKLDFLYRHDTNGFCHFGLHFLPQLWIRNFRSTTPLFKKNFLLVDMLSCDWPINCTWIQLWKVADAWWIIGEIRSSSNDHQSLIANSFFHASTSIEWFDFLSLLFSTLIMLTTLKVFVKPT